MNEAHLAHAKWEDVAVESWYEEFMDWAAPPQAILGHPIERRRSMQAVTTSMELRQSALGLAFVKRGEFFQALHHWPLGVGIGTGARVQGGLCGL